MDHQEWRKRQGQWAAFRRWEAETLRREGSPDHEKAVAWMAEAWETAAKLDPHWRKGEMDLRKVHHLMGIRAALARLGGRP